MNEHNDKLCYKIYESCKKDCKNVACKYWINSPGENKNCTIICAEKNSDGLVLDTIGNIFGFTKMRISQIIKKSIKKLSIS